MKSKRGKFWRNVIVLQTVIPITLVDCERDYDDVQPLPVIVSSKPIQYDESMPKESLLVEDPLNERFDFPSELEMIKLHASRRGIEPELLMAIRKSENGARGKEYGIIPQGPAKTRYNEDRGYMFNNKFVDYQNETEKQIAWAAATLEKRKREFEGRENKYSDFIDFVGDSWAPANVSNDPKGLNANWEANVRYWYGTFKN